MNCIECGDFVKSYKKFDKRVNKYYESRSARCGVCERLKQKYGITRKDRDEMYAEQDGKCVICKDNLTFAWNHSKASAAVDHCHTSGKVRGLLCMNCNMGLGKFQDNPEFLRNAADYLEDNNGL